MGASHLNTSKSPKLITQRSGTPIHRTIPKRERSNRTTALRAEFRGASIERPHGSHHAPRDGLRSTLLFPQIRPSRGACWLLRRPPNGSDHALRDGSRLLPPLSPNQIIMPSVMATMTAQAKRRQKRTGRDTDRDVPPRHHANSKHAALREPRYRSMPNRQSSSSNFS
jgi:hypothetical protein